MIKQQILGGSSKKGPFWGVLITRIIIHWGLCLGALFMESHVPNLECNTYLSRIAGMRLGSPQRPVPSRLSVVVEAVRGNFAT